MTCVISLADERKNENELMAAKFLSSVHGPTMQVKKQEDEKNY